MKQKILKLSTIILLFSFLTAGCQKDEIWELQIDDEEAVILKEVNGVEFKFCLLNELGEPATVFNEGENFTFQLSVKNNLDTDIYFDNDLLNAEGFCEVRNKSKSFGIPYKKPVFQNTIGLVVFKITKGQTSGKVIPWISEQENWNLGFIYFTKSNNDYLPKGKYFTEFSHSFDFNTFRTDKLTFKINFEIK